MSNHVLEVRAGLFLDQAFLELPLLPDGAPPGGHGTASGGLADQVDEAVLFVAGEADGVAEQPIARLGTVDLAEPWRPQKPRRLAGQTVEVGAGDQLRDARPDLVRHKVSRLCGPRRRRCG
jgi:hypothetical protein